jgi:hypothetical protein
MKLYRFILCGLLFSTGFINAQTNFKPGYIIKKSGDTLFGKIDYRGDFLMSKICTYKDSANTTYEFRPNDIKAFRFIDSKYFVSREINGEKVFLEYLIKGKINIYYMGDEKVDHFYLDKENEQLIELPYEEGFKYVDNKKVYFKTTKHIGILNYYMQDAPELSSQIQNLKKPECQNLIKLAEDYNNAVCRDKKCIIYEKKHPYLKVLFEPFVGITKYKGYDKIINEFGCFLYLWTSGTNEKLFFKTGLLYNKLPENGVDLIIYKLPIQIQYIYRAYKIQPYVSGGINLEAVIKDYNQFTHTLSLNAGLNYRLCKWVSISTGFNSDYTSLIDLVGAKDLKFDLISYSIICGLLFDF